MTSVIKIIFKILINFSKQCGRFFKVFLQFFRQGICNHGKREEVFMAKIIENEVGRRMVKMSVDDIISVVREYQRVVQNPKTYEGIRMILSQASMYLPEDI